MAGDAGQIAGCSASCLHTSRSAAPEYRHHSHYAARAGPVRCPDHVDTCWLGLDRGIHGVFLVAGLLAALLTVTFGRWTDAVLGARLRAGS
ncbi:hypothetical protein [Parafrankia sp. EUN1f]|uniref:hypothetical protein n=1 Tax=Parafrankia sp. EUN1f TaxID=102897 RepID=UPI0001C44296|nr:hypothetical protein [Parafrankia sp. EUN1f]EFC85123.1 hypothetical protein FrEUN1fDRAFT_1752 [Parafrankia sp. EUN1f]